MVKVRKRKIREDNSYKLKRLASYNPLMYDGALVMEKLFDILQFFNEWRAGFAVSYLKD